MKENIGNSIKKFLLVIMFLVLSDRNLDLKKIK